jgi:hypothetical protein
VACDKYSVPASVKDKIDFITPTLHFDMKLKARDDNQDLITRDGKPAIKPGNPNSGDLPKVFPVAYSNIIKQLKDCDKQVRCRSTPRTAVTIDADLCSDHPKLSESFVQVPSRPHSQLQEQLWNR